MLQPPVVDPKPPKSVIWLQSKALITAFQKTNLDQLCFAAASEGKTPSEFFEALFKYCFSEHDKHKALPKDYSGKVSRFMEGLKLTATEFEGGSGSSGGTLL